MNFDITIFRLLNNLAGQSKFFDFIGSFLADKFSYIVAAAALAVLLLQKNWRKRLHGVLFITFAILLSVGFFSHTIQFFYNRPRPPIALENVAVLIQKNLQEASFPSDHAAFFFALAASFYFIDRRWFKYFLPAAVIIGIARVFVGVHYPADILAGALIGWLSAAVTRRLFSHFDSARQA